MNYFSTVLVTVIALPAFGESLGLTPLNSLGDQTYKGFKGGLYAEGRNEPWGAHADALRRVSATIQPLDKDGKPDPKGKIVIVGIGASVCVQVFNALETVGPQAQGLNPVVQFVNCAKGGQDVNKIADSSGRYWQAAKAALAAQGTTPAQVQVAWYQSDELRDSRDDFPGRPQRLKDSVAANLRQAKEHFPNLRICYHSARHTTAFMPGKDGKDKHAEPRPYFVGWTVKWLIEEQAAGQKADLRFEGKEAPSPLHAWAEYFWTDGDQVRADGYKWTPEDVVKDGVHLQVPTREKVAKELIEFWRKDAYSKQWFTAAGKKVAIAPGEVLRKSDDPRDPSWIVNGANKIPKLQRLLGTTDNVRVLVRDLNGKQVAEIRDVFTKRTDLNALLGAGQYRLEFYDRDAKAIKLTQEVGEILRLK